MNRTFSLILAAALVAGGTAPAAESGKPNILIIVADDLGYGELGMQGFTREIPTPQIDSIAANGTRFTSGYVSGPYCSPTRAALLTGRYQQRFGHEFNPGPAAAGAPSPGLSLKEKTIGDRLKAAGYVNGWFGKSHLGSKPEQHPLQRGFDEYFGFLGGAHSYRNAAADSSNPILRGTEVVKEIEYTTEAFARETVNFIKKHQAEPWFVYLPFNAVHAPLETLEKYESRFASIQDTKRRRFAAMLSALDDAVGSVLTSLRESKQEENTLIFFFSDNGGPTASITSGNGPLRGFKAQTWEGGVRVPFAVQWKGTLPAGKTDDRPVIQIDILPTVLAATGVEANPEWKLDGVNLLPYLKGEKKEPPHDALYWRFGAQMAIRKGDWKLVKGPAAGVPAEQNSKASAAGAQLFNLAKDMGEKEDLAAREPEKAKELSALWEQWNSTLVPPAWTPGRRNAAAASTGRRARDQASNAAREGPWKAGDVLSPADSPRIEGKPLRISADIEPSEGGGVIVAQGAGTNGFSFFVAEGKLSFALRSTRLINSVTAPDKLPAGRHTVAAALAADGTLTFTVDGHSVGNGKLPGPVSSQPGEGLTVGSDGSGAVGEYTAPNKFAGKVENVTVRTE